MTRAKKENSSFVFLFFLSFFGAIFLIEKIKDGLGACVTVIQFFFVLFFLFTVAGFAFIDGRYLCLEILLLFSGVYEHYWIYGNPSGVQKMLGFCTYIFQVYFLSLSFYFSVWICTLSWSRNGWMKEKRIIWDDILYESFSLVLLFQM